MNTLKDSISISEKMQHIKCHYHIKTARLKTFNKLVINHTLPLFVDGERAIGWITDRFNGLPTTPNCGTF